MKIKQEFLDQLQLILKQENLFEHRGMIEEISSALNADPVSCAAALLCLYQNQTNKSLPFPLETSSEIIAKPAMPTNLLGIKLVRYRLEVGANHQLNAEELKNLLVEESGVDRNNIQNINILPHYTILELPDEMPIDIFQHLKTATINQQKLGIKRVKSRNKRRSNNRFRRSRQRNPNTEGNTEKLGTEL